MKNLIFILTSIIILTVVCNCQSSDTVTIKPLKPEIIDSSKSLKLGVLVGIGRHQGVRGGIYFEHKIVRTGCGYGLGFTALGGFIYAVDMEYAYSGFIEHPNFLTTPIGLGCSYSRVYKMLPFHYQRDYIGGYLLYEFPLKFNNKLIFGIGIDGLYYSKYPVVITSTYQVHIDVKLSYSLLELI